MKGVTQHRHLQNTIYLSCSRERRARIHLNKPWLQVIVDQDIIAIDLETMLILDYFRLLDDSLSPTWTDFKET